VAVNTDAAAKVLYSTERFNTLAFFVKEGLIDFKLLYRFNPRFVIGAWERLEPYVMGVRKISNPKYGDSFEWLYKQYKREQELVSKTA